MTLFNSVAPCLLNLQNSFKHYKHSFFLQHGEFLSFTVFLWTAITYLARLRTVMDLEKQMFFRTDRYLGTRAVLSLIAYFITG